MAREPRRGKVNLVYIAARSARRQTFRKRRMGLVKKLTELTTLCAVQACAIVKSPEEDQPLIWSSSEGAPQVVQKFRSIPEELRVRKMLTQQTYLHESIAKVRGQRHKQEDENKEKFTKFVMFDALRNSEVLSANSSKIHDLGKFVHKYIKNIDMRLISLNNETQDEAGSSTMARGVHIGGEDVQAQPTMDPNHVNRGTTGSHGMMIAPHHHVFPHQY